MKSAQSIVEESDVTYTSAAPAAAKTQAGLRCLKCGFQVRPGEEPKTLASTRDNNVAHARSTGRCPECGEPLSRTTGVNT